MREVLGGVVINEIEAKPLSDYVIDFLIVRKKENSFLDFKLIIPKAKDADFPEIAKDIFAFSNYGGGWILVGWEEYAPNQFVPVGLPDSYQLDQATLQEKFNSFSEDPLTLEYAEFKRDFRKEFSGALPEVTKKVNANSDRFAIIYAPPSHKVLVPKKEGAYLKGSTQRIVFRKGDIFYRRGTQSINPSDFELVLIKKRLEKEGYRLSVLSGEPDDISEKIFSNLFEVSKLPPFIYSADKKILLDDVSIKALLKQEKIFPEFFYKFKEWSGKILTFENLSDQNNPYRKLVDVNSINKESTEQWLADPTKRNIVVDILNRELRHYAINKGFFHFKKTGALYYSTMQSARKETWRGRGGQSTRTVAAQMYAEQFGTYIYWHAAFFADFLKLNEKFYLRILPTFVITTDGKRPISNFTVGSVITRLSYNKYNSTYLNTILFWIHQLGQTKDVEIGNYLTISSKPLQLQSEKGILYDLPSSDFTPEDDAVVEEESVGEDNGD